MKAHQGRDFWDAILTLRGEQDDQGALFDCFVFPDHESLQSGALLMVQWSGEQ
jgi:hypothetical protein